MDSEELFNCSINRVFERITKFWNVYGDKFPEYYRKYFVANIFEIIEKNNINSVDDITKSIFNFLGLLSFQADKESQFLSFFEQFFDARELYSKRLVSITSEYLPTLAKKITEENKHAMIRTYGPNIITSSNEQSNTHSKAFSKNDLENDDEMIISFAPRENVEKLVWLAINNRKELLLNFDGYIPENGAFFKATSDEYIHKIYESVIAKKDDLFDASVVSYSLDEGKALVLKRK